MFRLSIPLQEISVAGRLQTDHVAYRQTRDSGARVLDAMRFETIVNGCETMLARTTNAATMRQCLESRHVIMQTKTNKEFWKALGGV